jgi:hypothetical protein
VLKYYAANRKRRLSALPNAGPYIYMTLVGQELKLNVISLLFPDKAPSEATFRGAEYLSYDLSTTGAEPIVSAQDSISLNFKTRQPSGLLFYTGKAYWGSV